MLAHSLILLQEMKIGTRALERLITFCNASLLLYYLNDHLGILTESIN